MLYNTMYIYCTIHQIRDQIACICMHVSMIEVYLTTSRPVKSEKSSLEISCLGQQLMEERLANPPLQRLRIPPLSERTPERRTRETPIRTLTMFTLALSIPLLSKRTAISKERPEESERGELSLQYHMTSHIHHVLATPISALIN